MGTPTAEVIEKLSMFGIKSREIVQAQRLQFLVSGQVDEGFCKGVCLDWTRRVLQGGHHSFEKPGGAASDDNLRRQTLRQATIQLNTRSKKLVATTWQGRRSQVRSDLVAIYNRNLDQESIPLAPDLVTRVTEFFTFTDRPAQYRMDRISNWIDVLNRPAGTSCEVAWRAFAESIDKYSRETLGKDSSRPFTGIRILASTDREPKRSGEAAIEDILSVGTFTNDTVLIGGFGLRLSSGRDSGHAVAMHKLNTGKFMFLDPNYGVFEYTRAGLKQALMYLFGRSSTWQRAGADFVKSTATPIYGEDGDRVTNAVSYMVFGV